MRFNFLFDCLYYTLQNALDNITNENNKEHNKKMAIHSRSPVHNFDN